VDIGEGSMTNGAVQLTLTLDPVHRSENNEESQRVLNLRREDFNTQCWEVLKRMLDGEKLSSLSAINTGIGDIRRRAKDLIDGYGIPVKREWAVVDGKRQDHKEYYIAPNDRPAVMRRIIHELKTTS
jgi:hypothetical protein